MPTYDFRHRETGEILEKVMRISERDEWLAANPEYETVILSAPSIGDPVRMGVRRMDGGFKEVLSNIKKAHPLGTFNVG